MLKRAKPFALALIIVAFAATSALSAEENALENAAENIPSAQTETVSADKPQEPAPAPEEEDLTGHVIVSMDLQGNQEVNRDHIMSVVT